MTWCLVCAQPGRQECPAAGGHSHGVRGAPCVWAPWCSRSSWKQVALPHTVSWAHFGALPGPLDEGVLGQHEKPNHPKSCVLRDTVLKSTEPGVCSVAWHWGQFVVSSWACFPWCIFRGWAARPREERFWSRVRHLKLFFRHRLEGDAGLQTCLLRSPCEGHVHTHSAAHAVPVCFQLARA